MLSVIRKPVVAASLLFALAVTSVAARCIEDDSIYVDEGGYTHIVGHMTNETDIAASSVTLRGQLFDAGGNVYAETTALLCPMSVQGKSQNAFDLRFPQPNLPRPARYEVRPISGNTIAGSLPASHLAFQDLAAYRVEGTLAVAGSVRNDGASTYSELLYCSAAYDAGGKMLRMQWSPLQGSLAPGQTLRVPVVWPVLPPEATHVSIWVAVGPSAQWLKSDKIAIQNRNP